MGSVLVWVWCYWEMPRDFIKHHYFWIYLWGCFWRGSDCGSAPGWGKTPSSLLQEHRKWKGKEEELRLIPSVVHFLLSTLDTRIQVFRPLDFGILCQEPSGGLWPVVLDCDTAAASSGLKASTNQGWATRSWTEPSLAFSHADGLHGTFQAPLRCVLFLRKTLSNKIYFLWIFLSVNVPVWELEFLGIAEVMRA